MSALHTLGRPNRLPARGEVEDSAPAATQPRPCLFCGRRSARVAALPGEKSFLCIPCAQGVGRFAGSGPHAKLGAIWKTLPAGRSDAPAPAPASPGVLDDEETDAVFSEFNIGVEHAIRDPQVHADLAVAYREMGLVPDALQEAVEALTLNSNVSVGVATQALALLLNPSVLNSGALEKLRLALSAE